jgi:hypothetical protein
VDKIHPKELIVEHKDRFLARKDLISRDIQTEITRYLPQRDKSNRAGTSAERGFFGGSPATFSFYTEVFVGLPGP